MSGLYWVDGPWPGKLAISARPRGGDWLDDEVSAWSRDGFHTIVSLLTSDEERELSLESESSAARAHGMGFVSVPIPDRQVPSPASKIHSSLQELDRTLASGKNVLVHCRQGIGRSGLFVASLLINRGWSSQAAMKELSALRGTRVPETPEQEKWIEQYAAKVLPQLKVGSR